MTREQYEEQKRRRLPEPFAFSGASRALGYNPDRGSLYRVLQEPKDQGHIALHSHGKGTEPTRYRPPVTRKPQPGA
jgi:hypothetical protein